MPDYFRHDFRSADPDVAEQRLREIYGDVRLGGGGGYEERVVGDDRFAIARIVLSGSFEVNALTEDVTFATATPGYAWTVGRDEGTLDQSPAVFQPEEPMSSRIDGPVVVTTVTFDPSALEDLAAAVYGEPLRVWFDGQRPQTTAHARLWQGLVDVLGAGVGLDDAFDRATTFHALAVSALEAFRLAGDRPSRTVRAEGRLRAYRAACRFIDENPTKPFTVADVAAAAGVSEAVLRAVFEAHSTYRQTPEDRIALARADAWRPTV
jgi:hypothetical protein